MTYRGKFQGGVIVLESGLSLPDGTEVDVTLCIPANEAAAPSQRPAIWDHLLELAREVEAEPCDLPEDLARNHDHYLYGTPKRP